MKRIFLQSLVLLICGICSAQNPTSLKSYLAKNPKCLTKSVIYDGCTLYTNCDSEYLFVRLSILHPEVQMRLLMEGITIYIDPTGKKKEKYAVIFPSANEVKDLVLNQPHKQDNQFGNMLQEKPADIIPLIDTMKKADVVFDINGKTSFVNRQDWDIEVSEINQAVTYSVIIPIEKPLMEKKLSNIWSIGIYSEAGAGPQKPQIGGSDMRERPSQRMPERRENNTDEKAMHKVLAKDINVWSKILYEQICSLNN